MFPDIEGMTASGRSLEEKPMLLKVRDPWSHDGNHIVTSLNIYKTDRGGDRLRIVFARSAGENDEISVIGLSMKLAERAIEDAAAAGKAITDLTPESVKKLKKKYPSLAK
jgi:hypothetical protein